MGRKFYPKFEKVFAANVALNCQIKDSTTISVTLLSREN